MIGTKFGVEKILIETLTVLSCGAYFFKLNFMEEIDNLKRNLQKLEKFSKLWQNATFRSILIFFLTFQQFSKLARFQIILMFNYS